VWWRRTFGPKPKKERRFDTKRRGAGVEVDEDDQPGPCARLHLHKKGGKRNTGIEGGEGVKKTKTNPKKGERRERRPGGKGGKKHRLGHIRGPEVTTEKSKATVAKTGCRQSKCLFVGDQKKRINHNAA